MGVTGLWRLLEPAGKPVPLETLDGKILAVDISIWLHQMVKGFQDAQGAPLANAHLLGLFQRLCKLLYYRIKPVFVFDGGVPGLKKQTIAKRQINKAKLKSSSENLRSQLINLLSSHSAINAVLSKKTSPSKGSPRKLGSLINSNDDDNLFKLPPLQPDQLIKSDSDDASSNEDSDTSKSSVHVDLHNVNIESETFKSLPVREKYDLLTELKETRKQNSWGRLHELPAESDNFSTYQMGRLLKRRKLQECIEETEKEMGGDYLSLNEMEKLLNEEGISTSLEDFSNRRVASDENTRFLFIKDVKQAMLNAKMKESVTNKLSDNSDNNTEIADESAVNKSDLSDDFDEDLEKAIKMSLDIESLENDNTVKTTVVSLNEKSENIDVSKHCANQLTLAKAFMLQNTDFTGIEIDKILSKKCDPKISGHLPDSDKEEASELSEEIIGETSSLLNETTKSKYCKFRTFDIGVETEPVPNKDQFLSPSHGNSVSIISDSSSESDGFEEVQDQISPEPGITLQLNYDHNTTDIQDDIFADVFQESKNIHRNNSDIKDVNSKQVDNNYNSNSNSSFESGEKMAIDIPNTDTNETNKIESVDALHINSESTESNLSRVTEVTVDNCEIKEIPNEEISNSLKNAGKPISGVFTETLSSQGLKKSEEIMLEKIIEPVEYIELEEIDKIEDVINNKSEEITQGRTAQPRKKPALHENDNEPESSTSSNLSNLKVMASEIENKHDELMKEYGKMDRMSRNISEEMTKDAQHLLSLFGIPYIISPMEAEAQCAFFEVANLTEGTITDDSDIWLFGGQTVYKNFFDQRKHVMQFLSNNIEDLFNLTRENLILLALLVGSDYTVGLTGVGPVTAMEILAEFPVHKQAAHSTTTAPKSNLLSGLVEFKNWLRARKTSSTNLRNKLKNVVVTDDFPSTSVVQAYLNPEVDPNKETFSWGFPDVTALREFARAKFGWSQAKTDEILNPVLKRLDVKFSQRSIQSFFKTNAKTFAESDEKLSKRVRLAIDRLGKDPNEENIESEYFNINDKANKKSTKSRGKKATSKTKQNIIPEEALINDQQEENENLVDDIKPNETDISELQGDNPVNTLSIKTKTRGKRKLVLPGPSSTKIAEAKKQIFEKLHKKDVIPQREKDKEDMLKNKMKAIELFRKNKLGPENKKKNKRKSVAPKKDAGLSEESSDSS